MLQGWPCRAGTSTLLASAPPPPPAAPHTVRTFTVSFLLHACGLTGGRAAWSPPPPPASLPSLGGPSSPPGPPETHAGAGAGAGGAVGAGSACSLWRPCVCVCVRRHGGTKLLGAGPRASTRGTGACLLHPSRPGPGPGAGRRSHQGGPTKSAETQHHVWARCWRGQWSRLACSVAAVTASLAQRRGVAAGRALLRERLRPAAP